jgi:hypothetical protein
LKEGTPAWTHVRVWRKGYGDYDLDFDVRYRYDKVLYIEKQGFNAVFTAEGLQAKYHMIIVSGQGYASRAARRLLYELQKKGLTIYCLHDLDIYGVKILNSLRHGNDKAPFDIDVMDLGVTRDDAERYGIKPERVRLSNTDAIPAEHRDFFRVDREGYSNYVTEALCGAQGKRMRIVNHCYYLIDKFHVRNSQLSIYNALAFPDAFALMWRSWT